MNGGGTSEIAVIALGGIVVNEHSLELIEEGLAVVSSGAEASRGTSFLSGKLHAVADIGVRAGPFRRLTVGPALNARLERGVAAERGQDSRRAGRIVTG